MGAAEENAENAEEYAENAEGGNLAGDLQVRLALQVQRTLVAVRAHQHLSCRFMHRRHFSTA